MEMLRKRNCILILKQLYAVSYSRAAPDVVYESLQTQQKMSKMDAARESASSTGLL